MEIVIMEIMIIVILVFIVIIEGRLHNIEKGMRNIEKGIMGEGKSLDKIIGDSSADLKRSIDSIRNGMINLEENMNKRDR